MLFSVTNIGSGDIKENPKASPLKKRKEHACLINFNDRYLFLSGGKDNLHLTLNSVEKYDIAANMWTFAPNLNEKRY